MGTNKRDTLRFLFDCSRCPQITSTTPRPSRTNPPPTTRAPPATTKTPQCYPGMWIIIRLPLHCIFTKELIEKCHRFRLCRPEMSARLQLSRRSVQGSPVQAGDNDHTASTLLSWLHRSKVMFMSCLDKLVSSLDMIPRMQMINKLSLLYVQVSTANTSSKSNDNNTTSSNNKEDNDNNNSKGPSLLSRRSRSKMST